MELTRTQQEALTRWHDLGTTTPTHPVLQLAYDLYYAPLGLQMDTLIYDALASLENPTNPLNFVKPRWNPTRVDRAWGQYSKVEPLIALSQEIEPIFASNGTIVDFVALRDNATENPQIVQFINEQASALVELSGSLSAATKLFIDAALEIMIQKAPESEAFAQAFIANPRKYASDAFTLFTSGNSGK